MLSALISMLGVSNAYAIEPTYDGEEGIKAQVFETNCLFCHSSTLSGSDRNGAPSSINFDSFEGASASAEQAIEAAVEQMTMPPSSSNAQLLNDEQKTAMLAWKEAGFPKETGVDSSASYDFGTEILTLPIVKVDDSYFKATLKFLQSADSPTGFSFVLETAEEITEMSDDAAFFDASQGLVTLPSVSLVENNVEQSKASAKMVLIEGVTPLTFDVTSVETLAE